MGALEIRNEILREVDALPLELQRRVLAYVCGLAQGHDLPPGATVAELQRVVGILDDASAREIADAIRDARE